MADEHRSWIQTSTRCYLGVKRSDGKWHKIGCGARGWLTPAELESRIREIKTLRSGHLKKLPALELKIVKETTHEAILINSRTEKTEEEIILDAHNPKLR